MKILKHKPYAQKWIFDLQEYIPYILPKPDCSMFETDLDTEISCASCGRSMLYGDGYTSKTIHNNYGLGYCVCEECYNLECAEEREYYQKLEHNRTDLN